MLIECGNTLIIKVLNCEFNCDYCNLNIKHNFDIEQVLNEAIKKVKSSKSNKFNTIWISGGEPLLYQDKLIQFCFNLRKIYPSIRIYIKTFLSYYMSFFLSCLVNGVSISIKPFCYYDNFDTFVDNFIFLPKQFFSLKEFRLVVHRYNIYDLLETLYKFLARFKKQERAIYKDFIFRFIPAKFKLEYEFKSSDEILNIIKQNKNLYSIIKNNLVIDF